MRRGVPGIDLEGALIEQQRLVELGLAAAQGGKADQGAEMARLVLQHPLEQLAGAREIAVALVAHRLVIEIARDPEDLGFARRGFQARRKSRIPGGERQHRLGHALMAEAWLHGADFAH